MVWILQKKTNNNTRVKYYVRCVEYIPFIVVPPIITHFQPAYISIHSKRSEIFLRHDVYIQVCPLSYIYNYFGGTLLFVQFRFFCSIRMACSSKCVLEAFHAASYLTDNIVCYQWQPIGRPAGLTVCHFVCFHVVTLVQLTISQTLSTIYVRNVGSEQ